jgi:hypothetical protein
LAFSTISELARTHGLDKKTLWRGLKAGRFPTAKKELRQGQRIAQLVWLIDDESQEWEAFKVFYDRQPRTRERRATTGRPGQAR